MIGSLRVVGGALKRRAIRSVLIAFLFFGIAEWARWVALLVYGFEHGGARGSGAIAVIQLVPAAILTPFSSSLADRFPRPRVLLAAYLGAGVGTAGAGVAIALDAPFLLVAGLSAAALCCVTLVRPTQASLLPQLVSTPAELTAANATSSLITGSSILIGPAVAAAVIGVSGVTATLVVAGGSLFVGAAAIALVHRGARAPRGSTEPVHLFGGFGELARDRGAAWIVLLLGVQAAVWGAVDVLIVGVAIDELGLGGSGAGLLAAAIGVGGVIGAAATVTLIGRRRLTPAMALGIALWSLPLIAIAVVIEPWPVIVLLAIAGAGFAFLDVSGRTLLQRAVDDETLGRVFGLLESGFMASWALGSAAGAAALEVLSLPWTFVCLGVAVPLVAALGWRRLSAVDAEAAVPVRELELLAAIDIFRPLPARVLERLARALEEVRVPAGTTFIKEREQGDRFYVVAEGEVRVAAGGAEVARLGPGGYVGEIALLRDVPRQASVTAVSDVRLLALGREPFLAAMTGSPRAAEAVDREADRRLETLTTHDRPEG